MITAWHGLLITRPRLARALTVLATVWGMAMLAVCLAPQASAAANGMLLNWTGLRDTYGVAPGDYVFAMASLRDQIIAGGPDVGLNPASWMQWLGHTMAVLLASVTAANVLTTEAGLFVAIVTGALWLFRLTVSTYWLTVVGEIAQAITHGVVTVTTRLGLIALAVPVGVFAGVLTMRRGERGRGWMVILLAVTMPALSVAVFADPAGQMYGPDGVLAFGRRIGFSVAEAATHGGAIGSGVFDGQVDALTASLLTHVVREPLQLWNFGHVVDRVGGCGAAWSAAVRLGVPEAPVMAMARCGDTSAVSYAQHLNGSNAWAGLVLVACSLLLGFFVIASGWAVLKVSVLAIWTTAKLLPALWIGGIPGAPQRHAIAVVWQFFRHGIEVLVYVVFVSVIGLAIERLVARPLPAQVGGDNPFAHVLVMGACCVAAVVLLRHVRRDMGGGHAGGRGPFRRATDVAVGMGVRAAVGGAGGAALGAAKELGWRSRSGARRLWGEIEEGAGAVAATVLGRPRPGFSPAGGGSTRVSGDGTSGRFGAESDWDARVGERHDVPGVPPVSVPPGGNGPRSAGRGSARRERVERTGDLGPGSGLAAGGGTVGRGSTGSGGPTGMGTVDRARSIPPISWPTTGHGEDVPPNLDEPPEDEWAEPVDLDGPRKGFDPAGGSSGG